MDLFERYLKIREKLPLLPEEDPANDWSHLTPEEKEGRNKAKDEKAAATKLAKEEEEKTNKTKLRNGHREKENGRGG